MDILKAWADWLAAKALVAEMEVAVRGDDYNYHPPKRSPLYDGPERGTRGDHEAKAAATRRAEKRLAVAQQLEATTRAALLAALDAAGADEVPA